ncbi:MAG: DegV family protein [Caldilineaceae bacterium]|nr:DegV family protein [Caldilineaceae bacterium]
MGNVQIVTDSNAFLTQHALEQYKIEVIPHRIKLGGSLFEEDADFSSGELFDKIQEAQALGLNQFPEVQAADVNTILDTYQRLGKASEQIVSIHMSSELSGMWMQARRAAEMLKGRYSIRVIDSFSTSYGLGLLVEQAAKAASEGATINDVARIVNGAVPHLYFASFAESLNYLERSAGLGSSQSLLGTMLGIKAMLMMEEGRLIPLEKVQTRDEVVDKLTEFVSEFARVERVGVLNHAYEQPQTELLRRLAESLPNVTVEQLTYPPSLAAYMGPNAIGVVVYEGAY